VIGFFCAGEAGDRGGRCLGSCRGKGEEVGSVKEGKLKTALVNVCLGLFWVGAVAALGTLVFYYNQFTDVFTMHSEWARTELPGPYNLALLRSTDIDLAGRRVGFLGMSTFWQFDVLNEDRVFIAYGDSPVTFRVEMRGYVRSLQGLWQGNSVTMSASGALERALAARPENTRKLWGTTVHKGARKATPWFEVTVPIDQVDMGQPIEERAIEVSTKYRVTYPYSTGSGPGFADHWMTIEHRFWLIPLSPSEIETYKAVRRDYRLKHGALTCLTGLGLAVLIGGVLSGGSYLLMRKLEK
jgi:hypothetical protein